MKTIAALGVVVITGLLALMAPLGAETGELSVRPITREGQVFVSFELNDGVTPDVHDAIQSGLATTFSYDIVVSRDAATWFGRTVGSVTVAASVRFDNLTRRYQLTRSMDGRVEEARPTEDQSAIRAWLTRFEQVPVLNTALLETNGEYAIRVRAYARPHNTWFLWPWNRRTILGNAKFTFIS
jgi:hypothetical protein